MLLSQPSLMGEGGGGGSFNCGGSFNFGVFAGGVVCGVVEVCLWCC